MPTVIRNNVSRLSNPLNSPLVGVHGLGRESRSGLTGPLAPSSGPVAARSSGTAGTHPRLRLLDAPPSVPPFAKILPAHDLAAYRQRISQLGQRSEVTVNVLGTAHGHAIKAVKLASVGPKQLSVIITAGVHGNEPCGPGAAMLLIDQLLAQAELRKGLEVTVIPMANPRAYAAKSRRTPENVDLNRVFLADQDIPPEVSIIKDAIAHGAYDLALDLHSGKASRNGFWTLHRNAKNLLAPALKRFGTRWTILSGKTKPYTMSHPGVGTSKNRSTLKDFFIERGVKWSVTLEAPGSISYPAQVLGQNDLMHEIIREAQTQKRSLS